MNIIVFLNDYSDWPREDIADWLCRVGKCKHEVKGGELPLHKCVAQIIPSLNFHNLAEAMRKGCLLRPEKVKSAWKRGKTGACAVGAMAEGAGFTGNGMPWNKIAKKFPELHGSMRHPLKGWTMEVCSVISSISDETDCSREQIADWLCVESGCKHPVQTNGLNDLGLVA